MQSDGIDDSAKLTDRVNTFILITLRKWRNTQRIQTVISTLTAEVESAQLSEAISQKWSGDDWGWGRAFYERRY